MNILIDMVTPLVGVWIEMPLLQAVLELGHVTPLVGVWIEIQRHF